MIEAAFENGVLFDVLTSFKPEVKIITKSNGQKEVFVQKRVLGRGGLGEVKLISAKEFAAGQSEIALAMKTSKDSRETYLNILKREADALRETAKWGSDHIIRMVDVAEDGSYILMETGADVMSMGPTLSQVMTVQEISEQLTGVANGLEMFWQRGYIHGDVKPGNILSFVVNGERVFKIIDIDLNKTDGSGKEDLDNMQSLEHVTGDFFYLRVRGAMSPFSTYMLLSGSAGKRKLHEVLNLPDVKLFLEFRKGLIDTEYSRNPRSPRNIAAEVDFRLGKMDDLLGYFQTVCSVVENSQIKLSPEQVVELKALKSMIFLNGKITVNGLSYLYSNFDATVARVKGFVESLSDN